MSAFVSLSRFFTTSGPRPFSLDFPESIDENLTIVDSDATEVEHSHSAIEHSEIRERMLSSIQMASPEQLRALVLQLADEIPEVQWSLVRSLGFSKEASSKDSDVSEVLHVDARSDVADSDEAGCSVGGLLEITRYSSPSPSDARSSSSWKTARSVNDWDVNMEDVPEIQSEVSVDVRSRPRWDMCVNCGKSFDVNAVRGPLECCYHPGKPESYYQRFLRLDYDFPRK